MHYASFTIFYLVRTRNGTLSQLHLQNRSFIIKVSIIVSTMLKHCTFFNKFCFNGCVCVYGGAVIHRDQKRVPDPLELEIQVLVSWDTNSAPLEEKQVLLMVSHLTRSCIIS